MLGKQDTMRVARLTAYYQIQIPEGWKASDPCDVAPLINSEVDILMRRWMFNWLEGDEGDEDLTSGERQVDTPEWKECLCILAEWHPHIKSLMDAIADKKAPHNEEEWWINNTLRDYLGAPTLHFADNLATPPRGQAKDNPFPRDRYGIPATAKVEYRSIRKEPFNGFLLRLTNLLTDFLSAAAAEKMKRCAECKSVFVTRRNTGKFCSERCVERAGQRRRRGEKKTLA
jgi:hypothetical protein